MLLQARVYNYSHLDMNASSLAQPAAKVKAQFYGPLVQTGAELTLTLDALQIEAPVKPPAMDGPKGKHQVTAVINNGQTAGPLVLVYYDGDPAQGGKAFEWEMIPYVGVGAQYVNSMTYAPQDCGTRTIYVVAQHGSGQAVSSMTIENVSCTLILPWIGRQRKARHWVNPHIPGTCRRPLAAAGPGDMPLLASYPSGQAAHEYCAAASVPRYTTSAHLRTNPPVLRCRSSTMPVETLRCRAILFDFDGVLVDSAAHIERHWQRWAADHDVDFAAIMQVAHGRRMLETLQIVAPHLDAEAEARRYSAIQAADTGDVVTMDGAAALLNSLPSGTWAIVTSGFGIVVPVMLRNGGLPAPEVLVTADDVVHGKPSPEPYLLAAARLSRTPAECVVVEDSPAGLAAAASAGMRSVAVASTHAAAELHAGTLLAPRLADIRVTPDADGTLVIEIARGG